MFKALFNTTASRIAMSLLLAATAFASTSALAEGDVAAGKARAASCAGCHGVDGKALLPEYPNLAGQHASYTEKQLLNYQSGERANAIMMGMAATLSEQDIKDISAYYASLPPVQGVASEDNLTRGMNIYRGGIADAGIPACSGCHGAAGNGNPAAVYPVVGGQNAAYSTLQLEYFRAKTRANDPNAMMRGIAERLTDEEISALANYMQGLN